MMNVATIGSGVIVDRMIEAMRLDGRYNLYCVYSRTQERAKEFDDKHGIQKYYTDMEKMWILSMWLVLIHCIINNLKWLWNTRSMLLMRSLLHRL